MYYEKKKTLPLCKSLSLSFFLSHFLSLSVSFSFNHYKPFINEIKTSCFYNDFPDIIFLYPTAESIKSLQSIYRITLSKAISPKELPKAADVVLNTVKAIIHKWEIMGHYRLLPRTGHLSRIDKTDKKRGCQKTCREYLAKY